MRVSPRPREVGDCIILYLSFQFVCANLLRLSLLQLKQTVVCVQLCEKHRNGDAQEKNKMFLLIMKSQLERKVDCLPHFKNENWSTSLTRSKILLTARNVRLPARLVFDVVSIFTTPGKFSQELPRVNGLINRNNNH